MPQPFSQGPMKKRTSVLVFLLYHSGINITMDINKNINKEEIEENLQDIGVDLNITESLLNLLECSLVSENEIKKSDIENVITALKRNIREIINKHDKLENIFEI